MEEWSRKIHDIMDEMRTRIFVEYRVSGTWQPRVNLYESRAALHLCVEMAGLEPNALRVECLDATHVRITGQRGRPYAPGLDSPFSVEAMEIDEGAFAREIDLPDPVDVGAAEITYDRGFLWITLPKTTT